MTHPGSKQDCFTYVVTNPPSVIISSAARNFFKLPESNPGSVKLTKTRKGTAMILTVQILLEPQNLKSNLELIRCIL